MSENRIRLNDSTHKREAVYLAEFAGEKCVLREYNTEEIANHHVSVHSNLIDSEFLPDVLHQDGRNVYFEYISGRDCKKEDSLDVASQVGKICASINQLELAGRNQQDGLIQRAEKEFRNSNFLEEKEIRKIVDKYNSLETDLKPEIAMEFNDIYPANFRIKNDKVYLVDIEGIYPMYKGRGIGKGFTRWFKTKKEREKFREGYEQVAPMDFATERYVDFMQINFLTWQIRNCLRKGKAIKEKDKELLIDLTS